MAASQLGSDAPIREFLTALASADSPQGAVSASAVAGAMGTSLLVDGCGAADNEVRFHRRAHERSCTLAQRSANCRNN